MAQIGDPGGSAGSALETDDALNRLHVAKAPLLEPVLDVDQFFGELIKLPRANPPIKTTRTVLTA